MSNLSPQQFDPQYGDGLYHGTHRNIEGGTVLPAAKTTHSKVNFSGLSIPTVAYATENEDTAWHMADVGARNSHRAGLEVPGRTRVHTVDPHPEMQPGRHHPDHEYYRGENLSEHIAPEFKITGTHDIKPDQQGTLPMNWNQFRRDRTSPPEWGDSVNHPDDNAMENIMRHGKARVPIDTSTSSLPNARAHLMRAAEIDHEIAAPEQHRLF